MYKASNSLHLLKILAVEFLVLGPFLSPVQKYNQLDSNWVGI